MNKLIFFTGLIGFCVCDVSSIVQAPYAPSGYRPSPARLALPGEYGAPPVPTPSVQVDPQNVQFAGQTVEVSDGAQQPSNAYLPPANQFAQLKSKKPKNEAFLPKKNPPKPFRSELNTGEVFVIPHQSSQLRNPVFVEAKSVFSAQQHLPQFQQIRQFNTNQRFQQQQQHQQQNQQYQQQNQRQQADPNVYGPPPQQSYPYPPSPPVHETVDERPTEATEPETEDTTDPNTVIAVSNASGQYYLLGKDNTLQRVVYEAIQTEDDIVNNGFTARLSYSPVEPIRDPVYGYDDEGHLVRIFNKK